MKIDMSSVKNKWSILIFVLIFSLTLFFRFQAVFNYNVAFTPDQARDMLEIRHIVVTHSLKFIGPITDIIGLYLGPFWYYFNTIPFLVSGGNPMSFVYFSIIVFHLFSMLIFILIGRENKLLGLMSSCLLLLSPISFLTTRFSFNANAAFYFSALFPVFIFLNSKKTSFIEGILCGIILQLQSAIGILFFPLSVAFHLQKNKQNRHLFFLSFGFFLTLLPQIAFEINHGLIMTRSIISEFIGNTDFLGSRLTYYQIISDRFIHFINLFNGSAYLPNYIIFFLIVLAAFFSKKKSTEYKFLYANLLSTLIFLVFFIFYPYHIKDWYLYGLVPFSIYSLASSLVFISSWNRVAKYLYKTIFIIIIINSVLKNISYLQEISIKPSDDPSNLKNMIMTVEKIYFSASGHQFKVYSYVPSVYDYGNQYLFWWYGTKTYGYQPQEISYLPNVPEYIKDNDKFWTKSEENIPAEIYLIIQHDYTFPDRENGWRKKFPSNSSENINLPWGITIEKIDTLIK